MSQEHDFPRYKAAAVQAGPIFRDAPQYFDLQATLEKALRLIEEAGKEGARLIVFPECWLPCFPYWSLDLTDDRATFADMWAKLLWSSIEVPSPETEALGRAAKKANAYVVMGINERDSRFKNSMYNSLLYLDPRGEIIGVHRKICNTVQERFFHTPGDGGDNLNAVFPTEIGRLGGSICGEHAQLTLAHHWMTQGIQVHCSVWPGYKRLETVTDVTTRALAFNLGCFAVSAATYIPEDDQPKNFYSNSLFNVPQAFRGGSAVVSPYGENLAGPVYDKETIVYATIDLGNVDRSRHAVNLSGLYSRWDLININVRQQSYEPVIAMGNDGSRGESVVERNLEALSTQVGLLEQQVARLSRELDSREGNRPELEPHEPIPSLS
ncbi:MAG: carbon-nitrogen hydrolase family protein [Acidobacteriota bacterium]